MPLFDPVSAVYAILALGKCPEAPAPAKIAVHIEEKRPTFNNDVPAEGFISPAGSDAEAGQEEFSVTGGMLRGNLDIAYSVAFIQEKHAGGDRRCFWISKLDMTVVYVPEIYIAHEYTPGSCVYEEISGHEMKHVVFDMQVIRQFLPHLQTLMEGAVAAIGPRDPVSEDGIAGEEAAFKGVIEKAAEDALDSMREARVLRHAELDTSDEYTRLSEACP